MMATSILKNWFYVLIVLHQTAGSPTVFYNQPKFCPDTTWNPNATTFANVSTIGFRPYDIFVNTDNTVYVTVPSLNQTQVWVNGTIYSRTISGSLVKPYGLFVSTTGDIYVDNGERNGRVDKWTTQAITGIPVMSVCGKCFSLFVDTNDTLYCSMADFHQIVARSLTSDLNAFTIVIGTGSAGSSSNMLNRPQGIFVDINFDLYVADCYNHRIQLFESGQLHGTTVAGWGAPENFTLYYPTAVVLDGNKYIFIVDQSNHRIVRSEPDGFRCLVGCFGGGSASNQLFSPQSMAFDSYGNIFVTDEGNIRIQKFILSTNSCNETIPSRRSVTSTMNTKTSMDLIQSNNSSYWSLSTISTNGPQSNGTSS